jgi:hypothetical protein
VLAKDGITGVRGWDAATAETFFTQQRVANEGTSFPMHLASRVINDAWTSRWGPLNILVNAMAVAQNAVVIAYRDNDNADWGNWKERLVAARWKVGLFSKQNGTLLWSDSLPVEPLRNGLCIDRSGNIVVALRDGRLVCFGTDQVHVAGADASMPALTDRELRRETAAGSWTTVHAAPAIRERHAPATLPAVDATHATQAVATIARSGARGAQPLWEVASNAHAGDTIVVLGAASQPAPVDPADYGVARDMTWRSERPCAAVISVSSSASGALHGPRYACDGDLTTRWSAVSEGTQTLTYDLGENRMVEGLTLIWYALRATRTELTVAVSADGRCWNEVDKGELRGRGTRETYRSFMPEPARYVRVTLVPADGDKVCDVYETCIHPGAASVAQRGQHEGGPR